MSFTSRLLVALLVLPLASAIDYYVSPSGNDANPGTLEQPFRSPQVAALLAQAGDVIYLRGGTYTTSHQYPLRVTGWESGSIIYTWLNIGDTITSWPSWATQQDARASPYTVNSGTSENPITVKAYPGETPVFQQAPDGWPAIFIADESNWVFQGIVIDGRNIDMIGPIENIVVRDSTVRNHWQDGGENVGLIRINRADQGGPNNISIINNTLTDLYDSACIGCERWDQTWDTIHFGAVATLSCEPYLGFDCGGTKAIHIINNTIRNVPSAFFFKNAAEGPITIQGNTIINAQAMGPWIAANTHLYDNLFINVTSGGRYGEYLGSDPRVNTRTGQNFIAERNTFVNSNGLVMFEINGSGHRIRNNIFFGSTERAANAIWDSDAFYQRGMGIMLPDSGGADFTLSELGVNNVFNENCYISGSSDVLIARRWRSTGGGNADIQNFNITRLRSVYSHELQSHVIVSSDAGVVFQNPAALDYTVRTDGPAAACADWGYAGTASPPIVDTMPPSATITAPTVNQVLSTGTTSTTLSVTTNEAATCRWSTSDESYGSMPNTMDGAGTTSHTSTLTGLTDGGSYTRYVRCQDTAGNAMTSSQNVSFTVANPTGICEATNGGRCFYIDPVNGDDDNNGSFAAPWRTGNNTKATIYASARAPGYVQLLPGDVVYLMDGVHSTIIHPGDGTGPTAGGNYVFFAQGVSGTANAPITLKGYPGHDAIIEPATRASGIRLFALNHWVVEDLTVRNAYQSGLLIQDANGFRASNLHIYDVDGIDNNNVAGIVTSNLYNALFEQLELHDNFDRLAEDTGGIGTENSANMVLFGGGNVTIRDSQFYHTRLSEQYQTCLKYKHGIPRNTDWFEVYNSTFENCRRYGLSTGSPNTHFHHNTIRHGAGIQAQNQGSSTGQTANILIEYNTLYNTSGGLGLVPYATPTAEFPTTPSNITYRNNIIYDPRSSYGGENGILNIGTYISDELYLATLPELTINDNCYYNPSVAPANIRFNFASATNFGPLGANYLRDQWQALGFDTNSVFADPQFADLASGNFTLQAGSPCAAMGRYADAQAPPVIRRTGDLNGDGVVDLQDVVLIIENFRRKSNYDEGADINTDGVVNIFDMVLLGRNWG